MTSQPVAAEPRRDGRLVRGDQTRRVILDHAVEVASLEGLDGLSLGRLASDLRASKSGVFAHFGSKEELQLAAIEAASTLYMDKIVRPGLSAPAGLRRVWRLCDLWLEFFRRRTLPGLCFFTAAAVDFDGRPGRVRDELARLQVQWRKMFLRAMDEARRLGEIESSADIRQLYFEIDALVSRAILDTQMHDDAQAIRRARAGILARLRSAATDATLLPTR